MFIMLDVMRSRRSAGSCKCIMAMAGDIDISWFQSIDRYPILSIVELYTEALVCSVEYKEGPFVWAG